MIASELNMTSRSCDNMAESEASYDVSIDLATFFASNPEAKYEEKKTGGLITRPWNDPTLALRIAEDARLVEVGLGLPRLHGLLAFKPQHLLSL